MFGSITTDQTSLTRDPAHNGSIRNGIDPTTSAGWQFRSLASDKLAGTSKAFVLLQHCDWPWNGGLR